MADPQPPNHNRSPSDRDFLLHLESYLARRDGVDKLLKISRYTAKLLLALSLPQTQALAPNLRSFDSSVGLSRKAFRLGKFVQDLNSLRALPSPRSSPLHLLAYGGEGVYYFLEQLVWLSKTGLISPSYAKKLSKMSAWFELAGYIGSISIKLRDLKELRLKLKLGKEKDEKLKEKVLMKQMGILQDVADAVMALADVRDGKGFLTGPALMATAGLVSAVISAHKNWKSC